MNRTVVVLVLSLSASGALAADGCRVSGTAYDAGGRPIGSAVVRLLDIDTGQTQFSAADRHAAFSFDTVVPSDIGRYRVDLLSAPTVVTGTRIPTRSILGMTANCACGAGQVAQQDVRAQVD
ncbi:carboxypeptidase-like regulatory domain-containing protein [Dokdonella sp.]|uniref:carboxypeptidase-like regulatory domain-containing protein n=1 Tax=Dokdonella sp. TaxID=2291710 RepID=UPI0037849518